MLSVCIYIFKLESIKILANQIFFNFSITIVIKCFEDFINLKQF